MAALSSCLYIHCSPAHGSHHPAGGLPLALLIELPCALAKAFSVLLFHAVDNPAIRYPSPSGGHALTLMQPCHPTDGTPSWSQPSSTATCPPLSTLGPARFPGTPQLHPDGTTPP
ncbi:hypothetical protein GOP47_0028642 [Adiantum capillus-veneris]|nr:hypothetical protein GOP47_0028642 [Adiantum capillus-veneris]